MDSIFRGGESSQANPNATSHIYQTKSEPLQQTINIQLPPQAQQVPNQTIFVPQPQQQRFVQQVTPVQNRQQIPYQNVRVVRRKSIMDRIREFFSTEGIK